MANLLEIINKKNFSIATAKMTFNGVNQNDVNDAEK